MARFKENDLPKSKLNASTLSKALQIFKYADTITEMFDQLDWADIHGPGYKIAPRHPDLMHIILPKIERVRQYHWRFGEEEDI